MASPAEISKTSSGCGDALVLARVRPSSTVAPSAPVPPASDTPAANTIASVPPAPLPDAASANTNDDVLWCWQETSADKMDQHPASMVVGNPQDCLVRFERYQCQALEDALNRGWPSMAFDGFTVKFETMKLMGYGCEWQVIRLLQANTMEVATAATLIDDDDTQIVDAILVEDLTANGATVAAAAAESRDDVMEDHFMNGSPSEDNEEDMATMVWCWKETRSQMNKHPPTSIVGDPKDCWIQYDQESKQKLEKSFRLQKEIGYCSPSNGYIVDFASMTQKKVSTGYVREVQRIMVDSTSQQQQEQSKVLWCWEETPCQMSSHPVDEVVGDPNDCWILYDAMSNDKLEQAYQSQNGCGTCSPNIPGYVVDFDRMIQTKTATGFRRKVRRILKDETEEATVRASIRQSLYKGNRCTVQTCPHCSWQIKFPETMDTPFMYCCNCHRSAARLSRYQKLYKDWGNCPFCGFYSEIRDFKRKVEVYSGGEAKRLERIEEWTVHGCRRCAKQKLVPSMARILVPFDDSFLGDKHCEEYDISHANGMVEKLQHTKQMRQRGQRIIMEAEQIYEKYLSIRRYSPDLHYSLYRARKLRNDFVGAESAIQAVLRDCGNYHPAIDALQKLMDQRLKNENTDDAAVLQALDAKYHLLLANCLDNIDGSSPPKLQQATMKRKVVWKAKNTCTIM